MRLRLPFPLCRQQLNGYTMTPLGAAAVNYSSARLGFHSGPKAMGPMALEIAWLKCSFTHDVFLFVLAF